MEPRARSTFDDAGWFGRGREEGNLSGAMRRRRDDARSMLCTRDGSGRISRSLANNPPRKI